MYEWKKIKKPKNISEYEEILNKQEFNGYIYSHKEYGFLWFKKRGVTLDSQEIQRGLANKDESSKYKHTESWLRKKQALKKYLPNHCERCGSKENLQIHHNNYRKKPGNEKLVDVNRLCEECHMQFHNIYGTDKIDFMRDTGEFIQTYNKYIK